MTRWIDSVNAKLPAHDWSDFARKSARTMLTMFPFVAETKSNLQQAFFRSVGRPFEREFRALPQLLSAGDLCLDVGANRGQSIDALRTLPFDVRVISFEPNPQLYRRLVDRYGDSQDVAVRPCGLGAKSTHTSIHVPLYNGYPFDGLGTVHEDEAQLWLEGAVFFFDPRRVETTTYACDIVALDDLGLDKIGFIKLDVQGSELDALQGAARTLERDRPILMIERPDEEIRDYLGSFGYRMYDYDPSHDRVVQVDELTDAVNMLFVHDH